MTLQEAYRILRRYQDWRNGYDLRSLERAELSSMGEAIDMILQSQGLGKPIADCERCRNLDPYGACNANQIGECNSFETDDEP